MNRQSKLTGIRDAVGSISNGDTLAIGGFLTSHQPMAIIREIIRQEIKDLTIVSPPTSLETDLLVAAGCANTVIAPYVGAEGIAPIAPWFRDKAENGKIKVKESDGGMLLAALEATDRSLPFMPWRGGVGTSIPDRNNDLETFTDPISGEPLIAVPAIEPDVAILHCAEADRHGNVRSIGDTFADALIARAARKTYIQVEEIVSNEEIRRDPGRVLVSPTHIQGVIEAPWGAHPFSCEGYYLADSAHLKRYTKSASAAIDGDLDDWEKYVDEFISSPNNHFQYIDMVGVKHLISLSEYGGTEL